MTPMVILGIETSGPLGSVALCRDERVLAARALEQSGARARQIMPAIARVFADSGVRRAEVAAVAVSQGPGSFTGLRIGITCAKTLAYALGWRAVGVPSLEIMVQNVGPELAARCRFACPVRDAHRGRVYGTLFEWDGHAWSDRTGVLLRRPQELAAELPEGTLLFGSGVRAYPELFAPPRFRIGDEALAVGRADAVARLGLRMLRQGGDVEPAALLPRYYRATEVEEKLGAAPPPEARGPA